MKLSQRFILFILFKCRTIGTKGKFLGPEWAERVYRGLSHERKNNKRKTNCIFTAT